MKKLVNLTQHSFSKEQVEECQSKGFNVVDTTDKVKGLLTFTTRPTVAEMWDRAGDLAIYAIERQATAVMCGGAPYFMPVLEQVFDGTGIRVVYSFSERVSVETTQPDGSVVKTSVFKHVGFIPEL